MYCLKEGTEQVLKHKSYAGGQPAVQDSITYFDTREHLVQWRLNETLYRLVEGIDKPYEDISIVCIGTDRSTGDSFGPLIGHMLSKLTLYDFRLFGTFSDPVHALTLPQTLEKINTRKTLVIAVDACVGSPEYVGYIGLGYEPVRPGSGLGKELPAVGDISVTGIVAMGGISPFVMLQNASLGMVYQMAEKTVFALQYALYKHKMQLEGREERQPVQGARSFSFGG